jgi:hypothetical protein
MSDFNPYEAQAGRELDQLIQLRFMRETGAETPAYSTDERAARRVLARLKAETGRAVVTGQTSLRKQRWFARYETDPSDGTEVLAETLALAICRLALVRITKDDPS